jgi:alpha-1,2-mannosyltransferase
LVATLNLFGLAIWAGITAAVIFKLRSAIATQRRGFPAAGSGRAAVLGLYHPHCDQRAGGEKVLWSLVTTLLEKTRYDLVIYSNLLTENQVAQGAQWMSARGLTVASVAPAAAAGASAGTDATALPLSSDGTYTPSTRRFAAWQGHGQFILHQASETFALPALTSAASVARVRFVFLAHTPMTDAVHYPRLTLLVQSLAAFLPALEALLASLVFTAESLAPGTSHARANTLFPVPDFILDTAGYPFALPVFAAAGIPTGAYVHYPIVTHSMIGRVSSGTVEIVNSQSAPMPAQARAPVGLRAHVKANYYRAFAELYRLTGLCASFVATNSHWTQRELDRVWRASGVPPGPVALAAAAAEAGISVNEAATRRERVLPCIFPPCRVGSMPPPSHALLPLAPFEGAPTLPGPAAIAANAVLSPQQLATLSHPSDRARRPLFVSLGQFRPEKNHMLQLDAFTRALTLLGWTPSAGAGAGAAPTPAPLELEMIGTTRAEDRGRIDALMRAITERGLGACARVRLDVPRAELDETLSQALGGLHCMRDEHFGIGVVELLDAGIITIAHRSAGPGMDIVVPAVNLAGADAGANADAGAGSDGSFGFPPVGYLAETEEEYAAAMVDVVRRHADETAWLTAGMDAAREQDEKGVFLTRLRQHARLRARALFSEAAFEQRVVQHLVRAVDRAVLGRSAAKANA